MLLAALERIEAGDRGCSFLELPQEVKECFTVSKMLLRIETTFQSRTQA